MCAILLAILLVLPLKLHQPAGAAQSALLWYNVHLENPKLDLETRRIQQLNPDYIALAEANLNQAAWRTLQQTHPNGCQHTEDSPFFSCFGRGSRLCNNAK